MVTAGHLACGPVTAMRSLSSALGYRHDREGAASHRPVGGGCRDGHDRRRPDGGRRDHADGDQASACSRDPAGAGRRRGGHRVRPGGPGGVRHCPDGGSGEAPAAGGQGGSPAGSCPPGARGGLRRAWQVTGAWQGPAAGGRPAGRRSRPPRRRSTVRSAARAESDERVLAGRAHRRAEGWPRIRGAGRPGHPRDPAHRGTRPGTGRAGAGRAGPGGSGRRAGPGPAVLRQAWSSAAASWLPAGNEPGRSRPGAVRTGRPAGASRAAP